MEKFDFNGRNYKVVNGLVHTGDTAILHPCYKGDNVLLDEYAKQLGYDLYQRPSGPHAYGDQSGKRSTIGGTCPTAESFKPNAILD